MNNEEDYANLYRLLAKCKFNIVKEQLKLDPDIMGHSDIISYYNEKIKQIDEFMVNIPIIIKGDS